MSAATPIFCLTLPEEPWKESAARAHFHAHGLSPTFVHGFNGMLIGLRPTNPLQFDRDGRPEYMHIAQTGCAVSHLVQLTVAIASGYREFICCEDDIELADEFASKWAAVRAAMPDGVEVVQLEYITVQYAGKPVPFDPLSHGLARSRFYGHCAACIWWRREAAIAALRLIRPIDSPYDVMLIRKVYPFLSHALCDPPLAVQRTAYGQWPSSIHNDLNGPYKDSSS